MHKLIARFCLRITLACILYTDTSTVIGLGIVMSLIIVGVIVAVLIAVIFIIRRRTIHQNKDSSAPEPSNGIIPNTHNNNDKLCVHTVYQ